MSKNLKFVFYVAIEIILHVEAVKAGFHNGMVPIENAAETYIKKAGSRSTMYCNNYNYILIINFENQ